MRIALICPYTLDRPGGVQVHVTQLASHLRDRGHETVIVAPTDRAADGILSVGRAVGFRYQGTVAPIALSPMAMRPSARPPILNDSRRSGI